MLSFEAFSLCFEASLGVESVDIESVDIESVDIESVDVDSMGTKDCSAVKDVISDPGTNKPSQALLCINT